MALQPLAVPNARRVLGNCGQQGFGCEACRNSLHCHRVVFAVFLLQSRAVVLRADADQFVSVPRDEGSCLQRPNSPPAESGAKESRAACTLQSTGVPPGRLGPLGGDSSWPSRPAGGSSSKAVHASASCPSPLRGRPSCGNRHWCRQSLARSCRVHVCAWKGCAVLCQRSSLAPSSHCSHYRLTSFEDRC